MQKNIRLTAPNLMQVIFDTNILIDLNEHEAQARIRLRELGVTQGFISTVSYIEFLAGAAMTRKLRARKFIQGFEVIQFDKRVHQAAQALSMRHVMKPKGGADFLIACIAKAHSLTVLTENVRDFNFGRDIHVVRY